MCRRLKNLGENNANDSKVKRLQSNTFKFGKCRICDDDATGFHYGVQSCEGCKVFYKRATIKDEIYTCYFGNTCELKRGNRKKCKACRYRACLEAGMSFQRVKMGRIPNSLKEKPVEEEQSDSAHNDHSLNLAIQPLKKRLLLEYKGSGNSSVTSTLPTSSMYQVSTCFCKDNLLNSELEFTVINHFLLNAHEKSMVTVHECLRRAQFLVASGIKELPQNDFTLEDLWIGACQDIKINARSLVILARELPELKYYTDKQLSQFVRSKFCTYFVLTHAQLFVNDEFYLFLPNGIHNTKKNFSKLAGIRFTNSITNFFRDFNSLNLTTEELAILIPFIISQRDSSSIDVSNKLQEFHNLYGKMLNKEFSKRDLLFMKRLNEVLKQLEEINFIDQTEVRNIKLIDESIY